jgi:hypothetical protein
METASHEMEKQHCEFPFERFELTETSYTWVCNVMNDYNI